LVDGHWRWRPASANPPTVVRLDEDLARHSVKAEFPKPHHPRDKLLRRGGVYVQDDHKPITYDHTN